MSNTNQGNELDSIDWAQVWHRQMEHAAFRGSGVEFWNHWAKTFYHKDGNSPYVGEVLKRLQLKAGWSVLDVGAGMGALAIPLAKRGHPVTALDHSPDMLEVLARNADRENIDTIQLVNLDWTKARVGVDFPVHDAVLVSRSLPSGSDVAHSLRLIDQAARHACFITWRAAAYNELEAGICNMLGIDYAALPDYIVLYNLLYSLGIYASVEIFRINGRWRFRSLDEAFTQLVRSRNIGDNRSKKRILDFLESKLSFQDGHYYQQKKATWTLISWRK
jgi:SAM-dependent methyltransferase